ncbi:MAG: hypothetical protein HYZ29_28560 [Myxococcales bacterium]|nr:hypothetical protein [Myxococcales bacterium]
MSNLASRIGIGGALLALAWACSSENTTTGSSTGGTGASAGAATGGAAGSGLTGGTGGAGGTAPTGGAGGTTPTGGAGGTAAAGGTGGTSDAAIDAPSDASAPPVVGVAGSVWCGAAAPKCSIANGGKCCYSESGDAGPSFVCQSAAGTCTKVTLQCDSNNDCTGGKICCLKSAISSTDATATCMDPSSCQKPDGGTVLIFYTQLCDPTKVSPTECIYPAGSKCQPQASSLLPTEYYTCK